MTRNKEMDGTGVQVSCSLHFKGSKIYIAILKMVKKKKHESLINQYMAKQCI